VLEQIRHSFGPGKADSKAMPSDRGLGLCCLEGIINPKTGGMVRGCGRDGELLGKPCGGRWCRGQHEALVRCKHHAEFVYLCGGSVSCCDEELFASLDVTVGCMDAQIIYVKADS
jgi:hypothetical protein